MLIKIVDGKCSQCMRTFMSNGKDLCFQVRSFCVEYNEKGESIRCQSGFKVNTEGNCLSEETENSNNNNKDGANKWDNNEKKDEEEDDTNLTSQNPDKSNLNKYIYINNHFYFIIFLIFILVIIS